LCAKKYRLLVAPRRRVARLSFGRQLAQVVAGRAVKDDRPVLGQPAEEVQPWLGNRHRIAGEQLVPDRGEPGLGLGIDDRRRQRRQPREAQAAPDQARPHGRGRY
jgi:hypothetical protein